MPEWTVEELGEIIVAAGTFWQEWNFSSGRFCREHQRYPQGWNFFDKCPPGTLGYIRHPLCRSSYNELLPASGFSNLNDIRDYLLQYYTPDMTDNILGIYDAPFVEYAGNLYINIARADGMPLWETATHTITHRVGCLVFVESIVYHESWEGGRPTEDGWIPGHFPRIHHFILKNGRISNVSECPMWSFPLRITPDRWLW